MATTDSVSVAYKALVDELLRRCEADDSHACRCLGALGLLAEGWRYGDPDPDDGPDDDGGGKIIDLADYVDLRNAAYG